MSSILTDQYKYASEEIIIYLGFFVLITGLIGNLFNIIVFTSLKTFRETTCAFYLTIASIVNIFQLLAGLLSRILSLAYTIDLTKSSIVLCKARLSVLVTAALISLTCMCFAAIDQYASLTIRWKYLCNKRIAYWFIGIACIIWCLHSIPVIIYSNIYQISFSDIPRCGIGNTIYIIYYSRIVIPIFFGFLPILIRILYGLLAFITVRSLSRRAVPIIRSRRDRQLTAMVLIEVVFDNTFTLLYIIYYLYSTNTIFSDSESAARDQLMSSLTTVLYYLTFSASFYIYFCSSARFRQQLMYVLIKHQLKLCWNNNINQIGPQLQQRNVISINIENNNDEL